METPSSNGPYTVILADPPWQYDVSHRNGAAAKHYPTMTYAELAAMRPFIDSLAAPDCILLLWATWPKLAEAALPLIGAWGFTYKTGLPWVKLAESPQIDLFGKPHLKVSFGTGYWIRGSSEPLLIATKGRPPLPTKQYAGVFGERLKHSRKPASVHQFAEAIPGRRIELFARRPRPKWDIWGNEVESPIKYQAAAAEAAKESSTP